MEIQSAIIPRCARCGEALQNVSGSYGYCYNDDFNDTGTNCPLYGMRQRIITFVMTKKD